MFKRTAYYVVKETMLNKQIPILIGLRRVGKSTILKQLAEEFENSEIIKFDTLFIRSLSALELMNHLHSRVKDGVKVLLLDEVQAINEWDMIVKELFDTYVCENKLMVVVTGSSSLSFSKKDTGVNRTKKILINPLDFDEYIQLTQRDRTFDEFESFLLLGGFPEYAIALTNPEKQLEDVLNPVIMDDIPSQYGIATRNIDRLLMELSSLSNGEFNKSRSSKNTGIKIDSINLYLDILENCQIIKRVVKIDENKNQGKYQTIKVYINPHFHLWLLRKTFSQVDDKMKGHIIESYWVFANSQLDGYHYQYFYLKTKDNLEIDFAVPKWDINDKDSNFKALIEFKYTANASLIDYKTMRNIKADEKIVWCKENTKVNGITFKNIIDFSVRDKIKSSLI